MKRRNKIDAAAGCCRHVTTRTSTIGGESLVLTFAEYLHADSWNKERGQ